MKRVLQIKNSARFELIVFLTITGLLCFSGSDIFQKQSADPINIGNRLELFVDDLLIGSINNAELLLMR